MEGRVGEESNPYLALREAKIQRNEARLKDLGLLRKTSRRSLDSAPRSKKVPVKREPRAPTRRSTRNRSAPDTYADVPDFSLSAAVAKKPSPVRATTRGSNAKLQDIGEAYEPYSFTPRPKFLSPSAARGMHVRCDRLVEAMLGRVMLQTGKAYCMEASAQVSVDDYGGGAISFNKYSGVQEWGNDVLFLWINLDNPQAEVFNDFPKDGKQVTWFGGSRMHDQTAVIQKLIRVGKRDAPSDSSGIVLWCRRYEPAIKGFSPYVCLGRLTYESHEPGSSPLAFVWNLHDYDKLKSVAVFRNLVGLEDQPSATDGEMNKPEV